MSPRRVRTGAASVETAIGMSKKQDVVSAGFVETQAAMQAVATSKGLFGYDRFTTADYNLTARTPDGTGSGWASRSFNELRQVDPAKIATAAIDKAARTKAPVAIEPGKYTVVLEPAAVADLLAFMMFSGDARQADEGRSYFSKKGGGNRIGETFLDAKMQVYSDPAHPLAPTIRFDNEGLPIAKNVWVEKGVLKDLFYSRFWAEKMGKAPTAGPANLIMDGGTSTMDDLISGVQRGVLVTRFWYIRPLDPQTILVTGAHARRAVPDREGQGDAAGEEPALERESDRRLQQPRRHDPRRTRRQRRGHRRWRRLRRGTVDRVPGRSHRGVHVHERLGRRVAVAGAISADARSGGRRRRRDRASWPST